MLSLKMSSVVSSLVEQLLQNDHNRQEGAALHFHFDCRMSHYGSSEINATAAKALHLLYHLRPGMTYIDVFSGERHNPFDRIHTVDTWRHEVTHDSVWREAEVFNRVYFELAGRVNAHLVSKGAKEVAPVLMSEHTRFGIFGQAFQWVQVDIRKDPADQSNYRKILTLK